MLLIPVLYNSGDNAVIIDVNIVSGGKFGKTRHSQDFAGNGNQEAGAGSNFNFPHGNYEVFGQTQKTGVVGQRLLGFGNTDRQLVLADFFN